MMEPDSTIGKCETRMVDRYFFHSFPRPKDTETTNQTFERGLKILSFMKNAGVVLAPEIVEWKDVPAITGNAEYLSLLQRRVSFTELSLNELPLHSKQFGPIAIAFNIGRLRGAGALPVIYVPQLVDRNPLSAFSTLIVRGAFHTRAVLQQLHTLGQLAEQTLNMSANPLTPIVLDLHNTDPTGQLPKQQFIVPSNYAHALMTYVGFRNIPFDHSVAILDVALEMFYPTDNAHTGDLLGYYRQREWRFLGGDLAFNNRPIARKLTDQEQQKLTAIDPGFWQKELEVNHTRQSRASLAQVYEPNENWNFFDMIEAIFVPRKSIDAVRDVVGDKPVLAVPEP